MLAKFYVCGVYSAPVARVSILSGVPQAHRVLTFIVDSFGLDSDLGDFAVTSLTVVIVDSRCCLRHCSTRVILFSFVAEWYRIWLRMITDCINRVRERGTGGYYMVRSFTNSVPLQIFSG